jgi:translation initiation factor 2D
MPTTTLYTAHILPACPFSRTGATPVNIEHSAFKSLSDFLRVSVKLKDARPDVVVAAVSPIHADDVVAHQPHCTVEELRKASRDDVRRNAKHQAAEAANAERPCQSCKYRTDENHH